jgi:predicted alpha/beta superfamily hydrolase
MAEHTLTGNIIEHREFRSKVLANRRDVLVYLPRNYRRFSRVRFPVLYLQDGQNVFDAATSFAGV